MPKFGYQRKPLYRPNEAFAYAMGPLRLTVAFSLPCPHWLLLRIVNFQEWRDRRTDGQ